MLHPYFEPPESVQPGYHPSTSGSILDVVFRHYGIEGCDYGNFDAPGGWVLAADALNWRPVLAKGVYGDRRWFPSARQALIDLVSTHGAFEEARVDLLLWLDSVPVPECADQDEPDPSDVWTDVSSELEQVSAVRYETCPSIPNTDVPVRAPTLDEIREKLVPPGFNLLDPVFELHDRDPTSPAWGRWLRLYFSDPDRVRVGRGERGWVIWGEEGESAWEVESTQWWVTSRCWKKGSDRVHTKTYRPGKDPTSCYGLSWKRNHFHGALSWLGNHYVLANTELQSLVQAHEEDEKMNSTS